MKTQFKNKSVAFHEMELKFEEKNLHHVMNLRHALSLYFSVVEKMY